MLAGWLSWNLSREELVAQVQELFRRLGPALPGQVRIDLENFLEERSTAALAKCLAMNEEIDARDEFVDWRRRTKAEGSDSYRLYGVRREDFCEDRGPGRNHCD
jgi:hypothetical protein